jgi:uncharacterized membrane protein YeiH
MKLIRAFSGGLEALSVAVYLTLGTALFGYVCFWLPASWAAGVLAARPIAAGTVLALCAAAAGAVIRDVVRRQWSMVSKALFATWAACLLLVVLYEMVA